MSDEGGIVCLLTVHGVGFQQGPGAPAGPGLPARPGYADLLHQNLAVELAARPGAPRLSDDPDKQPWQPADLPAPVYVTSNWPPKPDRTEQAREAGLARLDAPLVRDGAEVAHVALVYTGLEESRHDLGALLLTGALGVFSIRRYASLAAIGRMVVRGIGTHAPQPEVAEAGQVSLRVRADLNGTVAGPVRRLGPDDRGAILLQLEDDIGAYVIRNERRELVRGFVQRAVLRLLARQDVRRVVVNTHSQGTVVAYDVLRQLPGPRFDKIAALVTAGSPLKKYATTLSWGREVGRIQSIPEWLNFYDPADLVADPLAGRPAHPSAGDPSPGSLLWWRDPDTGDVHPSLVEDERVDNVHHTPPSSFPSHNYWDNRDQFVPRLADVLATAATAQPDLTECSSTNATREAHRRSSAQSCS